MGEARKRKAADAIDAMIGSQAGTITQADIPPSMNVFATMEAAWLALAEHFERKLTPKQMQDAKFIFFHGVQAAGNLMIYCAGQSKFEAAADQIIKDCVAYEKEAVQVLRERTGINGAGPSEPTPQTH